jgi:integral membrane protein
MSKRTYANTSTVILLRTFQVMAYAEGGLLPSILIIAIVHWVTGYGDLLVKIIGATHGTVFTVYILLVPVVARMLRWSKRTTSIAFSVAFVPFATWAFERRIHSDITARIGLPQPSESKPPIRQAAP